MPNAETARARLRAAAGELELRRQVRRRPWMTVAIALGAGLAAGYSPALRRGLMVTAVGLLKRIQ